MLEGSSKQGSCFMCLLLLGKLVIVVHCFDSLYSVVLIPFLLMNKGTRAHKSGSMSFLFIPLIICRASPVLVGVESIEQIVTPILPWCVRKLEMHKNKKQSLPCGR